jgi:7-cyano-7-deazaguanine synthase in queuosine biosynthesis
VLCGGASHNEASPDALRLHTGDADGHALSIKIEGLEERLAVELTPRFKDLIRIAAYVLAADCATTRGSENAVDLGATWRRDFRFVVPVLDLGFWTEAATRRLLRELLRFLSDDSYDFSFVQGSEAQAMQLSFSGPEGAPFVSWGHIDEVMLFSGGMDSFAGAVEEVLTNGRQVLLVSHRSSTKMHKVQRRLVDELRTRAPKGGGVRHIAVEVQRQAKPLRVESTQRSRSLLFAAIAGAVASVVRRDHVRFYENGIIALNLPISKQLVGARATRTVHPKTLVGFQDLLSLVADRPVTVDNPFQELTREDVVRRVNDAGVADLLRDTRSCARVWGATIMHPSCGLCSQCIDRQFAVRAAGVPHQDPDDMYRTAAFKDAVQDDDDAALGVAYVSRAATFRAMTSARAFVAEFGEVLDAVRPLTRLWTCSADEVVERLMKLHQRQGEMVLRVLQAEMASRTSDLLNGKIHPNTLLARCVKGGMTAAQHTYGVEAPPPVEAQPVVPKPLPSGPSLAPLPRNLFRRDGAQWRIGRRGHVAHAFAHRRGFEQIALVLARHPEPVSVHELDSLGRSAAAAVPAGSLALGLDKKAVRELLKAADRLRANIAAVDDLPFSDRTDVSDDRRKLEIIETELSKYASLGGVPRHDIPEIEDQRQRVKTNIRQAIEQLVKGDKDGKVGVFLRANIKAGTTVRWVGAWEPWDL